MYFVIALAFLGAFGYATTRLVRSLINAQQTRDALSRPEAKLVAVEGELVAWERKHRTLKATKEEREQYAKMIETRNTLSSAITVLARAS